MIYDMHFALCLFQPLPDVFVGVRLVLPASVTDDREELARYFVAYPFVTECCVRLSVCGTQQVLYRRFLCGFVATLSVEKLGKVQLSFSGP